MILGLAFSAIAMMDDGKAHNVPVFIDPAPISEPVKVDLKIGVRPEPALQEYFSHSPDIPANIKTEILNSDIEKLKTYISGDFNNEAQVFFAPELQIPQNKIPSLINIQSKPENNKELGENLISMTYRLGDENGKIMRKRIWQLSPKPEDFTIIAKQYDVREGDKPRYLVNCDFIISKNGNGFIANLAPNCRQANNEGDLLYVFERHEISKDIWQISDYAENTDGKKIYGNNDNFPNKYDRKTEYICWAGVMSAAKQELKQNIIINNRGGEAKINIAEKNFRIKLREIEWPYGNNRPSLTLYLFTGTSEIAQIYSWGEKNAERIGLAFGEYQASCTKNRAQ